MNSCSVIMINKNKTYLRWCLKFGYSKGATELNHFLFTTDLVSSPR